MYTITHKHKYPNTLTTTPTHAASHAYIKHEGIKCSRDC